MKPKKVPTAFSDSLQEISKELEPISQRELEDIQSFRDTLFSPGLTAIRERLEFLQSNIIGRMRVGVPVEKGELTASVSSNWLSVLPTNEEK